MRGIQDSSSIASSQIEVAAKPVRQSGNTIAEQVRSSDLPMPHAQISRFHQGVRKFAELLESENTREQITRKAIRD